MKTINTKLRVLLLVGLSFLSAACSRSTTSSNASTSTYSYSTNDIVQQVPGIDDSNSTSIDGKTVTFKPVSLAEYNSYVATHPLNNPTQFKITVDLSNISSAGRYAGTIKLSYVDNGQKYNGSFTADSGRNTTLSNLKDNGVYEANYNRWFTLSGKTYFSGYFQDTYGAIVVVIENLGSYGDAVGSDTLTGTVYYKNFAQSYTQQSPYRKCWFIYNGPYSCRDAAFITKASIYPTGDSGFRKLGTFTGLSKSQAFQQ